MREEFERLRAERFARLSEEKRRWFETAPGGGLSRLGVEGVRAMAARVFQSDQSVVEGVRTEDVHIPGPNGPVPTRLYRPPGEGPFGVHVHIHAGGYIMLGGLGAEGPRLSALARDLGCMVVAPDFRLPPGHRFPAGIEDCWSVVQWAFASIAEHGGDPGRIGIGGGCTGGVVSAVMALMARDAGLPLRYLYMAATVTDTRESYRSYLEFEEGYTLTKDTANYVTGLYLRDDLDRFDWRASPVLARSVAGLPPTLVVEGEWDVLHDEAQAWADRLRDAGVGVTFREHPEEGHSFSPPTAALAQTEFEAFLRRHLAGA